METTFDTVEWTYDNLGRATNVQARNGSTVVNEVAYEYNGFGQALRSYQEHAGAKTASSLSVKYLYTTDALSLPRSISYPDDQYDYTMHYKFATGASDYQKAPERLGRPSGIALETNMYNGAPDPDATNVVSYEYLGAGGVIGRRLDKSAVTMRADADGSSSGGYDGLDRFGRISHLWVKKTSTPTATHNHIAYGYDAASNVTGRDEQAASVPDESYTYDGLHRLGSATVFTSPAVTRDWTVTLAGNWKDVKDNGMALDTRSHNPENAISSRTYGSSVNPVYDKSGSMTRVPDDRSTVDKYATVTYDAWNRPVKIKDNGTSGVVAEYTYNGLGRVAKRVVAGVTRFFYYDEGWRVLTERSSTSGGSSYRVMDYVWGAQYIDELVCRKASTTRMDFVQDTNWNVIALLNSDGTVAERYRYDPYGKPTFMNANGTPKTTGILNSTYLFQGRRLIEWKNANVNVQTYHFRNREYLPVLGRFLQRDPIGVWGDAYNLGNTFAFVGGSPVGSVDSMGLSTDDSRGTAYNYSREGEFRRRERAVRVGFDNYPTTDWIMEWAYEGSWYCDKENCKVGVDSAAITKSDLKKEINGGRRMNAWDSSGFSILIAGVTVSHWAEVDKTFTSPIVCPIRNGKKAKKGTAMEVYVTVSWKKRKSIGFNPGAGPASADIGLSFGATETLSTDTFLHRVFCCCYETECEAWQEAGK